MQIENLQKNYNESRMKFHSYRTKYLIIFYEEIESRYWNKRTEGKGTI